MTEVIIVKYNSEEGQFLSEALTVKSRSGSKVFALKNLLTTHREMLNSSRETVIYKISKHPCNHIRWSFFNQ